MLPDAFKNKTTAVYIFICLNSLSLLACSNDDSADETESLHIFAAASLSTVMPQLAHRFETQNPGTKIDFNLAASSILAKQIENGADADIYFSANPDWVDYLERRDQIKPASRFDLLGNKLVVIARKKNEKKSVHLNDLEKPVVQRIALADWAHVPAGIYAKQALEKFGVWEKIRLKCIPALDVRAALSYVERGEVDCGIVYRTDAAISKKVVITDELPDRIQPNIRYVAAIAAGSKHPQNTKFLSFLKSQDAKLIFENCGFKFIYGGHDD